MLRLNSLTCIRRRTVARRWMSWMPWTQMESWAVARSWILFGRELAFVQLSLLPAVLLLWLLRLSLRIATMSRAWSVGSSATLCKRRFLISTKRWRLTISRAQWRVFQRKTRLMVRILARLWCLLLGSMARIWNLITLIIRRISCAKMAFIRCLA